jgi:cytochrome c-type biogenesis protein CcmH/NrfG
VAFGLTAWYLISAGFAASPAAAVAGALGILLGLGMYFLGRYLGALWLPGREAAGWDPLIAGTTLLALTGVTLHALGLTPSVAWPGSPPLTVLGDLVVPPASVQFPGPRLPWVVDTGRLAAVLLYPNTAAALLLIGLVGATWSLGREGGRGKLTGPGPRAVAGFLLVAGLLLTFSRGAWVLWPGALIALGVALPRGEATRTVFAGVLLWGIGLAFLLLYLPALSLAGAAGGLVIVAAGCAVAWLAGGRLRPSSLSRMVRREGKEVAVVAVAVLVAVTALSGLLLPREAALRLAWPAVSGEELAGWWGRLVDGARAVLAYPLSGVGPGGWAGAAPEFRHAPLVSPAPPNLLLQAGAETGLPGLLLLGAFLFGPLVALIPIVRRGQASGLIAAWVALAVATLHGLADHALGNLQAMVFLFLLVGLVWGLAVRSVLGPERKLPQPPPVRPSLVRAASRLILGAAMLVLVVAIAGRGLEALGEAQLRAGRPGAARGTFARAGRLNPLSSRAFWGLARAHLAATAPDDLEAASPAIAAAAQLLRLDPGNPSYQSLAGQMTMVFGFADIGLRALETARRLDPVAQGHWENLVWGYYQAGQRFEQLGDGGRAEAAYRMAIGWSEQTVAYFGPIEQGRANLALGVAHMRMGQLDLAREAFRRALEDPRTATEAAGWLDALEAD